MHAYICQILSIYAKVFSSKHFEIMMVIINSITCPNFWLQVYAYVYLQEYSKLRQTCTACVSIIHNHFVLSALCWVCGVIHVTGVAEQWAGQWVGQRCPAVIHIRRGAARSPRGQSFVMALIYEAWPGRTAEFGSPYNEKPLCVCVFVNEMQCVIYCMMSVWWLYSTFALISYIFQNSKWYCTTDLLYPDN